MASGLSEGTLSNGLSLIFGSNSIGSAINVSESHEIMSYMIDNGVDMLDTASMYGDGVCEETIGTHSASNQFIITTKANPLNGKRLTPESIRHQLTSSLARLKRSYVDLFYLHLPDHSTPIEESLSEVQKLYSEGLIKEFGLSNYKSWEVVDVYHTCKSNGWVLPTAYQGMYNAVTRGVEGELFPALRKFGLRFEAYNPLGGGILTGKHKFSDMEEGSIQKGRFQGAAFDKTYKDRYWHKSIFNALDRVQETLNKAYGPEHTVTLAEAALRWIVHHSQLSGEQHDAVILGASSLSHCRDNLLACKRGPLDPLVVAAYEEAWEGIKGSCPNYFR